MSVINAGRPMRSARFRLQAVSVLHGAGENKLTDSKGAEVVRFDFSSKVLELDHSATFRLN